MKAGQARIDAATAKARQQATEAVKRTSEQAAATVKNGANQIRAVVGGGQDSLKDTVDKVTGGDKKAQSADASKTDNSSSTKQSE